MCEGGGGHWNFRTQPMFIFDGAPHPHPLVKNKLPLTSIPHPRTPLPSHVDCPKQIGGTVPTYHKKVQRFAIKI